MTTTPARRAMADVDKVAAAIALVDGHDWEGMIAQEHLWRDSLTEYRAAAVAAIDALGLTEETAYLPCTDSGGHPSMHDQRRLVTPWQFT